MVKNVLENELKALEPKIQTARVNNDFGTYKNLILAYKEVLHLIQDIERSTDNKNARENDNYEVSKRMAKYEVIHGTLYKNMFKCCDSENIKVIFYCSAKNKFRQFENMIHEEEYINLFADRVSLTSILKDEIKITFLNGSYIHFVGASDNARVRRYDYAVVDKEIDKEILQNVIYPASLCSNDNYNIELIDM